MTPPQKWYSEADVRKIVDKGVAAAIAPLLKKIDKLESEIAALKKNSSNSSKPPSSDIVKPPKAGPRPKKGKKRKKGAQAGHKRHERKPIPPEKIDRYEYHEMKLDPREWRALDEWETLQQIEMKVAPVEVIEHWARRYQHKESGEIVTASFPKEVKAAGLIGPNLSAFVAYLKGFGHMSYTTIATLLDDVFGIDVSRGLLAKVITDKVSSALARPYDELRHRLPAESRLGIDETGHKDDGARYWTWCFRSNEYTLFHIADTRGSEVLFNLLGVAFDGVITCDYFSAYRKFLGNSSATMQFCLAHLIRDVKYLADQSDKIVKNWAVKALDDFTDLFRLIHRRDKLTAETFQKRLIGFRDRLLKRFRSAPMRQGARDLRERFKKFPDEFFTFMITPGVQPTNNMTEQAIRYVVIDRKITQGTRGSKGQRWCERIWTTISTCHAQGLSVYDFLRNAVLSYFRGDRAPSLVPRAP